MQNFFNKIVIGECLDEIKKLPDKSFDLVFADPPYNLQIGDKAFTIGSAYVPVYQTLLMTVYAAYFAGRSIEKVKKVTK